MVSKDRPYVLYVAEIIYNRISEIKRKNPVFTNIDAIDSFIGCELYKEISSGEFHDKWFEELKKNKFIDIKSKKKISKETLDLLNVQKNMMMKQMIQFPELYYAKSHYPLELSQRAFNQLWRMCESYELWCKESNNKNLIKLKVVN